MHRTLKHLGMKKIILFLAAYAFIAGSFTSLAQGQLYFNEGDTIYGRDTTYHYQWWSEQWLASDPMNRLCLGSYRSGALQINHGRLLRYNYTEQPLNIVGIATSIYTFCSNDFAARDLGIPLGGGPCDIPPEKQEYVLLYEADTSRSPFYEVGRIPFDYSKPARYMDVVSRWNYGSSCCTTATDNHRLIKIREFYFDKPITVRDSFYVGHTTNSNPWPDPERTTPWNIQIACWTLQSAHPGPECPPTTLVCEEIPYQLYKMKQDDFSDGLYDSSFWYYFSWPMLFIEFPIIEIDSSFYDGPPQYVCPQVQNFRISYAEEGQAVMLWDTHGDHQSWQISYGPAGTEPDGGTIINCPIQVGQIMGLDTCTDYVAYIRAVCNHDSIVFSEWSEPLTINICDTTGGSGETESIEGGMGQYIQLFPSPATDQVQVMSSFELRGIEVYDLQGRTLLSIPCEGHSAAFDVENWPKGMYVALVRTGAGNFTKKLVVR